MNGATTGATTRTSLFDRVRAAVVALVVVTGWLAAPAPAVAAAGCDPARPDTCTLRELADRLGMRIGATAEPPEVVPGPYRDTLLREFNAVTPENAMKWYTVQSTRGVWNFGPADAVVDAAVAGGLSVRGHTLVWAQDTYTPEWVKAIDDPDELRAVLEEHIGAVMGRYGDRVHRWDVVNEPLASLGTTPSDSVFARVLGPDWVAEVFALAHAADPDAELWINEFGTDVVPGKHEAFLVLVEDLLDAGVPLHGVGLQTHRPSVRGPSTAFQDQLQDYADLGLAVAITELDIPTDPADPDAFADQADAYRRIVGACLAVPACEEVTTWGLTDASTWLDHLFYMEPPTCPLLFDEDYEPKPAYDAVQDLLAEAVLARAPTSTSTPTSSTSTSAPAGPAAPAVAVVARPDFTG